MERPLTSTHSGVGPYESFLESGEADPFAFLEAFTGEPRGYWGAGNEWVAWVGELARVELSPGAPLRFETVRREAGQRLVELGWDAALAGDDPGPRFFGGFSFRESDGGDPFWTGFPSAVFLLPRLLLEGVDGGFRLLSLPGAAEGEAFAQGLRETGRVRVAGREVAPTPTRVQSGDRESWLRGVDGLLRAVERGEVEKTVLARYLGLHFPEPVDPLGALRFLRAENPRSHVYFLEPVPGRVLLGAAPELLAGLRGDRFFATAVAGSMSRAKDPTEDRALARRLLESEKNRREHRVTAEEMVEVLSPLLLEMEVEREPRILSLPRIHHLETTIRGRVGGGEDILSLIEALHPTPAVCGRPRGKALALLEATEPFDRGWYSGPVGWFDGTGAGDFVPALRAAVGGGREWRVFAGAGIVAGSDAQAEWEETELKFDSALRALSVGGGVGGGAGGSAGGSREDS